ncbi:S-adenosyl-L-methionine-dependent methyltransferase [Ceratobasidium sp. AG-I]|nr:S-adenosyl-L-methionine-dependent methyltransferase [Ceratobasidium sp. AG-I]
MDSNMVSDSDSCSIIEVSANQSSAGSVYSFSSSRDGSMLREADGRTFNSQNDIYFLPADELEYSRLDKQHLVHLFSNDGLFARDAADRVRAVLDANTPTADGSPKRVLDLGCGGGIWAISVALEFPHAEIVGVDLAPNTARSPPANCRFEFDDFSLGLSHYNEMFDVVHARSCGHGVTDYRDFINDMAQCLRPGGVLLIVEGSLELRSHNKEVVQPAIGDGDLNKSWFARVLSEAYNVMKTRGSHVEANATTLYQWACENPFLEDEGSTTIFTPMGPWERGRTAFESRKLETIGELMRQNSMDFGRAVKPLLVSEGIPPEMVDRFIAGTDQELTEMTIHMYAQWHYVWGIRRTEPESGTIPSTEPPALAMADLGNAAVPHTWVGESAEVSGTVSDSGSDVQTDADFIDVDSDRDMEVESVTDV